MADPRRWGCHISLKRNGLLFRLSHRSFGLGQSSRSRMLTAAEGTERDRKRFGSVGVAHQMSQCFPPPSLCSPDCRLKGSPRGSRGQSCGGQGEFVGGAHLTGAGVCETPQAPEQ